MNGIDQFFPIFVNFLVIAGLLNRTWLSAVLILEACLLIVDFLFILFLMSTEAVELNLDI